MGRGGPRALLATGGGATCLGRPVGRTSGGAGRGGLGTGQAWPQVSTTEQVQEAPGHPTGARNPPGGRAGDLGAASWGRVPLELCWPTPGARQATGLNGDWQVPFGRAV